MMVSQKEIVMPGTSATRRDLIAISAAAGAVSLLTTPSAVPAEDNAIRPFRINIPEGGACRIAQAHRRDNLARTGNGHG
jgi:hypothetical protein